MNRNLAAAVRQAVETISSPFTLDDLCLHMLKRHRVVVPTSARNRVSSVLSKLVGNGTLRVVDRVQRERGLPMRTFEAIGRSGHPVEERT